jgi:hypothetical protein
MTATPLVPFSSLVASLYYPPSCVLLGCKPLPDCKPRSFWSDDSGFCGIVFLPEGVVGEVRLATKHHGEEDGRQVRLVHPWSSYTAASILDTEAFDPQVTRLNLFSSMI